MRTKPNENAFPCVSEEAPIFERGLTKREYFAALAMQSVLNTHGEDYPEIIAIRALKYANALINELNKDDENTKAKL